MGFEKTPASSPSPCILHTPFHMQYIPCDWLQILMCCAVFWLRISFIQVFFLIVQSAVVLVNSVEFYLSFIWPNKVILLLEPSDQCNIAVIIAEESEFPAVICEWPCGPEPVAGSDHCWPAGGRWRQRIRRAGEATQLWLCSASKILQGVMLYSLIFTSVYFKFICISIKQFLLLLVCFYKIWLKGEPSFESP